MKKLEMKSFFYGIGVATLVAGLSLTALATSDAWTITVTPINIQVNGETFQPTDAEGNDVPIFAYEGTTYAPLCALAEAYGLEVGYDAESNMATVGETVEEEEEIIIRANGETSTSFSEGLPILLDGEVISYTGNPPSITFQAATYLNMELLAGLIDMYGFNMEECEQEVIKFGGDTYISGRDFLAQLDEYYECMYSYENGTVEIVSKIG